MEDRTLTPQICNPDRVYTRDDLAALDQADDPWIAHALFYLSIGIPVIPLCGPNCPGGDAHFGHPPEKAGKIPVLKGWDKYADEHPTPELVRKWREKYRDCNLGAPMGGKSGLLAIDVDDQAGRDVLADILGGGVPPTLGLRTGGGGDRWFLRWPAGERVPLRHIDTPGKRLSFLGWGGQTAVRPSVHLSGKRYDLVGDWWNGLDAVAPVPDQLYDYLVATAGKKGPTVGGVGPVPVPCRPDRRGEARAEKYLAKCEPAISGQKGDGRTFRVLSGLLRTVGLTRGEALWEFMVYYNSTCEPKWEEPEIARKLTYLDENPAARDTPPSRRTGSRLRGGRRELVNTTEHEPGSSATRDSSPAAAHDQADRHQLADATHPRAATPPVPRLAGGVYTPNGKPAAKGPEPLPGRLASAVVERSTEWLFFPYIPRYTLSLIVGQPNSGKTTLTTTVMRRAKRTVWLPGFEETAEEDLIPRLRAAGVNLGDVLILDSGDWSMPRAEDRLADAVTRFGADLVVADPIDSYLDDGMSENDGQAVRPFLESFISVAKRTGSAVVGVRHPGKNSDNVMVGSRAWRAVPRVVVELLADKGPPERRIVRRYKDKRKGVPARYFDLVSADDDGPPVFTLGDLVDAKTVELARTPLDAMEQLEVGCAMELLPRLLAKGEMEGKLVYEHAERERIGKKAVRTAFGRLGVESKRDGFGPGSRYIWWLPTAPDGG